MELVIEGLSKTYPGGIRALQEVNLSISTGMFGLLGPNGAGKSTLMRTLATLQQADAGTVTLDGADVLHQPEKIRRQLGYLPQEFGLYPSVSAGRMLDYIALLKGMADRRQRREHVHHILRQTNLYDVRNRRLGTFSGGMKQRFGIAQALLGRPRLLIVDEPTAGLDPEERNRFHNLLSEISQDAIVILSTHIVEDVSQLCQRLAIIHQGRIRRTGGTGPALLAMEGKIWQALMSKDDLPAAACRYDVISTRWLAGRVAVRVLAEELPGPEFMAVTPEVEDLYFTTIRNGESRVA